MDSGLSFGQWLKQYRRRLGLTQAQFGQQTGYAGETLRKVEADELRPSRQMAEKLAEALQVAAEERERFVRFARDQAPVEPPALPAPVISVPHTSAQSHPLPLPREPLFGRDWELESVQNLLLRPTVGLVTLRGTGGVGKTRLALQVAANVRSHFSDGVIFVPLATIEEPALLLNHIAQHLGLPANQTHMENVQEYLRAKQMLLVLDNFEQVVRGAPLLLDLLHGAPHLKILVTSRTLLRLRAEHQFIVPPLALPQHESSSQPLDAALELFVTRAQAVDPHFVLTGDNYSTVAQICRLLDGLPLAIELAAARIRHLPPATMLARLDEQLKFLTGGARDAPQRQQTMRATLTWSYALLNEAERQLFCSLALFAGAFTLDAVEAICTPTGVMLDADVLELLATLLDQSLIQLESAAANIPGAQPRWRILRVIREYALERLIESGEYEEVQRRVATYYLAWAEQSEAYAGGDGQPWWFAQLEAEHDNLRAALTWCLAQNEGEMGLRICAVLAEFWDLRGHNQEGRTWLAAFLAKAPPSTRLRAEALDAQGLLAERQGDYGVARAAYEESLLICRQEDDAPNIARALHRVASVALKQGGYGEAHTLYTQSLAMRRSLGDKPGMAASLHNLGMVAREQGDDQSALALYNESLTLERELGNKKGIAISLNNLGNVARNLGQAATAQKLFEESLALRRELGDKHGIALALNNLGNLALDQGDTDAARALLLGSLALQRESGNRPGEALVLNNLGRVARQQGDHQEAARLYRASLLTLRTIGDKRIAECLVGLAHVAIANRQMVRAAHLLGATNALLERLGAQLESADQRSCQEAVALARSALGDEGFTSSWRAGRAMSHEETVAFALAM